MTTVLHQPKTALYQQFPSEEALMALAEDRRIEVIDGVVVEYSQTNFTGEAGTRMSPVGGLHHFIAGNLYDRLKAHVSRENLGFVFMDGLLFLLAKNEHGLVGARVPDVAYVSYADVPSDWDIQRPFPGAPTLAVEVISPQETPEDILAKVRAFLDAGTAQVWVAYPGIREVHQYFRDKPIVQTYQHPEEMIDADTLLPGIQLSIADIFHIPELKPRGE
jgi:Uma2 family endonuclease